MAPPAKAVIKTALRAALIAKLNSDGNQLFVKRVDGSPVPGVLPEHMDEFIDALADGIGTFWTAWQTSQVVTVPGVTVGTATVFGTLAP